MRDFNVKLNEEVLRKASDSERLSEDGISSAMKVANEILEVFRANKTNMGDAYLILASLTDSIYAYSVFGEELLD